MSSPQRLQLRRFRGWRKPADAIVVARPSRWGNPFPVAMFGRDDAVRRYRELVTSAPDIVETIRRDLAGHDLACWCKLTEPCHADVLLELANDL
jgi:hypothetical protein